MPNLVASNTFSSIDVTSSFPLVLKLLEELGIRASPPFLHLAAPLSVRTNSKSFGLPH